MSQQQQGIQWKTYQGREYCYWTDFKRINEYPMLVTQFIGDGNGEKPASYGPFEHKGYRYLAVEKPTRADPKKTYFNIERVPTSAPSQTPENGAAKGHQENIAMHEENKAMHKEMLAAIRHLSELIAEDINLRKQDGITLDLIRQHTEVVAKEITSTHSFKTPTITEEQTT